MKTLSLFVDDVDETLDAGLVKKIQAAVRNVRVHETGWLMKHLESVGHAASLPDWRAYYQKFLQRQFPNAWIYRGGRHLAVHASPPAPARHSPLAPHHSPEAGRCLFRIIEVQRLELLACGLHHGQLKGGSCWKCGAGIPQRNAAGARDRALVAAVAG